MLTIIGMRKLMIYHRFLQKLAQRVPPVTDLELQNLSFLLQSNISHHAIVFLKYPHAAIWTAVEKIVLDSEIYQAREFPCSLIGKQEQEAIDV